VNGSETMMGRLRRGRCFGPANGSCKTLAGLTFANRRPPAGGYRPGGACGPIRKCRFALRAGAGSPARHHVSHRAELIPVPDRAVGSGENLAPAPAVSVDPPDPGADH